MAEYEAREISTTRYEWRIPKGAGTVEFAKAESVAERRFAAVKGRNVVYDDDLKITADDESVIIYFTDDRVEE